MEIMRVDLSNGLEMVIVMMVAMDTILIVINFCVIMEIVLVKMLQIVDEMK